jgi:hypothetical protein
MGSCSRTKQAEDLLMKKEPPKEIPEVVTQEKEPAEQITEAVVKEKEPPPMIQIQNLSLTDKTLTLDYRLSNPFDDDIWVCYDTSVYNKQEVQHAATRIDGKTVRIQLRSNIERFPGFQNPYFVAKYIRLKSDEFCSGRIVRTLPAKDYVREWRESRKEHKEIDLHRVVFEVGYFGSKWNKYFNSLDSISRRSMKNTNKSNIRKVGKHYYIQPGPLITEETMDGQLREVMYRSELDPFLRNEEFAELVMTNVTIPCSVVVDDK